MGQKLQTQFNLNIKKIRHVVMKMIATTIAVTTLSLAILLVIVGIGAKSESLVFQSANAQVSVFPGTQPEKPSTGATGGTTGGTAGGPSSGPTGGTGAPGFNAKTISDQNSIHNQGNDIDLYVYIQKSGKYDTILHRTAVKLGFLQSKLG